MSNSHAVFFLESVFLKSLLPNMRHDVVTDSRMTLGDERIEVPTPEVRRDSTEKGLH